MRYTDLWISAGNILLASQLLRKEGWLGSLFERKPFRKCGNCNKQNVDFYHIEECFKK